MSIFRVLLAVCISFFLVSASASAGSEIWTDEADKVYPAQRKTVERPEHRYLHADISKLKKRLSAAPLENTKAATATIELPLPDGTMHTFVIEESPIMAPGLMAKFPSFKTYRVHTEDGSAMSGRVNMLPTGFHAYLTTDAGVVMIDPDRDAIDFYRSFYKKSYFSDQPRKFSCGVKADTPVTTFLEGYVDTRQKTAARNDGQLLTYDLAVAATFEYHQAVGAGNVIVTQAEIVNAIDRVNVIFERDLGVRVALIVNNDQLISTVQDELTNNDPVALLLESKNFIEVVKGVPENAYDIGHVFSTGAGGLATLGAVCTDAIKAEGVTGIFDPVGDAFYIDYVAHEIGHQFSADHSFNGTTKDCGFGNRNALTAFEPGSGSTIMGYAGIC
ncbi:MAG: hypothetical protein KAT12_02590, partial [Gammaproteobacteria bacterium]|nr:hypothetical protein [Gammaproteobacteria bacterium]